MKAKLIKIDNGWILMVDNIMYATDNDKLSLKNCQAIERGYDLDELAEKEFPLLDESWCRTGEVHEENLQLLGHRNSFQKGFQKCLELMGDKKFSEDDMKAAYGKGFSKQGIKSFNLLIQSLQQTEWDVEVVTFTEDDLKSVSEDWGKLGKPKLDADGCLILKRI